MQSVAQSGLERHPPLWHSPVCPFPLPEPSCLASCLPACLAVLDTICPSHPTPPTATSKHACMPAGPARHGWQVQCVGGEQGHASRRSLGSGQQPASGLEILHFRLRCYQAGVTQHERRRCMGRWRRGSDMQVGVSRVVKAASGCHGRLQLQLLLPSPSRVRHCHSPSISSSSIFGQAAWQRCRAGCGIARAGRKGAAQWVKQVAAAQAGPWQSSGWVTERCTC